MKNIIKKIIKLNKKTWIISILLLVVVLVASFFIFSGNGDEEVVSLTKMNLEETVKISGRVEADIVSDLGFSASGRVSSVSVKVNDKVFPGQRLASLTLGTLPAELRSAEADVSIKQAELNNKTVNLETITKKQDTLVESSYKKLLSDGLVSEPSSGNYTQTPPTISGLYNGPEGTYKVIINSDSVGSGDYNISVFDLEKIRDVEIKETSPTALGTKGLFIDFPDSLNSYDDTIWYVNIPNTKSDVYLANKNAYDEAISNRNNVLEEAKASLRSSESIDSSIALAELARAKANADKIRAQIGERILTAPFAGIITAVNVDPGESISASDEVVSIISAGQLGVAVDLPEVDSVKVRIGDTVKVTLDALGTGKVFPAKVVSVNRSETLSDGIPVYEAKIAFDKTDENIVSGMTADVTIITDSKEQVLSLPVRAIRYTDTGDTFVLVKGDKQNKEIKVVTGLRSTDGFVEIVAGLSGDEKIVVPK